jgi:hypothetical protein
MRMGAEDEVAAVADKIIVFPKKTTWTPEESETCHIGDPGFFRPSADLPVKISCAFTWQIDECERLKRSWGRFYSDVQTGGPAYDDPGGEFEPGIFVKPGITFTSRGCSKSCGWCLVPKREGWIRELSIIPGWNVADNNLLACSRPHIEKVFEMLKKQPEPIKFSGGLDAEMLQDWHVDQIKTLRLKFAWFACDYPGALPGLERVSDLMGDFSREKKRCYVLIGFNGETPKQAEKRLKTVYKMGFLPMAMLYRSEDEMGGQKWGRDWLNLRRTWCRPAVYRKLMKGGR